MARAARAAGVHHAIGLQLRASPAIVAARQLLAAGAIGRPLSIAAFSSTAGFGSEVPIPLVYLEDPDNFANLVTIQGAHTLDLVAALGGALASLSALASRQFPMITVGDESVSRERKTFDHLLVQGSLKKGQPFSMATAGGGKGDTPFSLEVFGDKGALRLEGGAARGPQSGRVSLFRDSKRVEVDEGETAAMPNAAANVAGVYAALRDDISHGTSEVVGFDHAERLTLMIEAVFRSSSEGRSVAAAGWSA